MASSSEQEDLEIQGDSSSDEEVHSNDAGIADEDTDDSGESEAGESEAEESDENETQAPALDASDTESDDDDGEEVDDEDDIPQPKVAPKPNPKIIEKINNDVMEKYKKRQGKQLYIRFPTKLPEDAADFDKQVKSLSELIVEAHKPRQKHARFCLVSFANTEDRDKALKKLTKNAAENKLIVSLPRIDSDDFVKTIAEKKLRAIEKKKAKLLLKRQTKKALGQKEFTSTIVVFNIPKSASTAQVKELFPDAVDMQIKPAVGKFNGVSMATITLPTSADARKNVSRKLSLGGSKLIIRFNKDHKNKNKSNAKGGAQGPKKGPLAPTAPVSNGNQQKKNKKKKNKNKAASTEEQVPKVDVSAEGKTKSGAKKNKANGNQAAEGQSPPKKAKLQDVSKAPKKKAVVEEVPQKKATLAVESQVPSKKGNLKGNNKFPQKQGNAAQSKKGTGKKPNQQNKQKKKKPLK